MDRPAPTENAKRDPLPYDEAVRRYGTALRRFFAKRARPGQDIDDLVQEILSRLSMRGTDGIANPEGYLFQMASNLLRDEARRENTRRTATNALRHFGEGEYEDRSPERVLRGKERVQALERALKELPERTRAIFVLSRFEELSYAEIGERLSVSRSLVEKSMTDAIKHLHHRLRQH